MKRIITIPTLALLAAVLLAGCATKTISSENVTTETSSEKDSTHPIVGRWVGDGGDVRGIEIVFFDDGNMTKSIPALLFGGVEKFTYSLSDNQIKMKKKSLFSPSFTGEYNINGEILTITFHDEPEKFRKAK